MVAPKQATPTSVINVCHNIITNTMNSCLNTVNFQIQCLQSGWFLKRIRRHFIEQFQSILQNWTLRETNIDLQSWNVGEFSQASFEKKLLTFLSLKATLLTHTLNTQIDCFIMFLVSDAIGVTINKTIKNIERKRTKCTWWQTRIGPPS